MSDCLFCKIISGDIPSEKVYEDDGHIAFMDIEPVNPGHALIVSKKHYGCLADMPDEATGEVFRAATRVAKAVMEATAAQGFNIIVNNGEVAGQVIFHTHVHAVPRFEDDGHKHWEKKNVPEKRTKALAEEIRRIIKGL